VPFAQRYFGEIMMPFRKMGQKALEKIQGLDIELIAPSHGPIHRNPKRILDLYRQWTAGETREKVVVVYVTMWQSTEAMVKAMVESLLAEGLEVTLHNLVHADLGDVARDLVDSRAIVLGTPTVLGGMHPMAIYAAHLVKALRPPLKYGVVLSSYGWGGGAVKQAAEILEPTKLEVVGAVEINGPPTDEVYGQIAELGRQLAAKVKGQA
jgi:flavorubredoxin